jgi:hypothetical protein
MIKQEVRSLVRNSLPKVDKSNRWHDNFLNAAIEKAIASLYHDVFLTAPLSLLNYTKGFGYTTPIAVSTENATGIKYCTLPESIIPLERKGSGVIRISTPTQGQFMFFPTDFREMDFIANGGFFGTVNSKVGYAVNQTRVEFYNLPASITSVRMDLLIPFSKYAEDDEVKIPEITDVSGTNYRQVAQTFMDRVMAILGVVQPVDLRDDNSGNSQVANKDN